MLYHFKTPRTRGWEKYIKKLQSFLESNESTAHVSAWLSKAQEQRAVLVKLLDECAKENQSRPDDIIKVLSQYLPILEQLIEAADANQVKLVGRLDIVWTSFLSVNINGKSLSHDLKWEKICCYSLLALANYQKAVELHHRNRQNSQKSKAKASAEQAVDSDPFFDEPLDANAHAPQIFDDKETVKEISQYLKSAASIWSHAAALFPVLIQESGKSALDVIPECFECVLSVLCELALVNAQEFMIQLAVQTNKSPLLTGKLAMGVSAQLKQCHKRLHTSLSKQVYDSLRSDLMLYVKVRSDLYHAIALKYNGKLLKQNDKHGECVAFFQSAISILKHAQNKLPVDVKSQSTPQSVVVIQKSIVKQIQSVDALLKAAKSDNNSVYFESVPKSDQIEPPEAMFRMKPEPFVPDWNLL